jgi:hypothetical protein
LPRFFFCDPSLLNLSGHCLGYLESIKRALPQESTVFLLGNKSFDRKLLQPYSVYPTFTYWIDHRQYSDHEKNAVFHSKEILKDLADAHAAFAFNYDDEILINSLRQWALLGVLKWLEGFTPQQAPKVSLILHFSAFTNHDVAINTILDKLYRNFFVTLGQSPLRQRVALFADSEALTREYTEQGAQGVCTAPIPHIPALPGHKQREPLVVSYMGAARKDKGFQYLPYLVKRTKYADRLPDLRFKVMAWASDPQAEFYAWNIEALQEDSRVELYREPLTEDEYNAVLNETDIGLVLYDRNVYARQTSGILSELVAAGAVLVVSRGTWAARQVSRYDLGCLSMPEDVISAGDALVELLADFPGRQERARAGREKFLAFHNPGNFVRIVFGVGA